MRERLAIGLSGAAFVLALFGSTPVGGAAEVALESTAEKALSWQNSSFVIAAFC